MLNSSKQAKLLESVKKYHKQFLSNNLKELDESGTRLMINSFLTECLGFLPIEEVKTEYMIRGTYADYVIQLKGLRHFLVEVKSLSLSLSDKHLRQAINYGANEGIEWALLTNGRNFDLYKILFNKPIESVKVFSCNIGDLPQLKNNIENLQYLHKDSVSNKGMDLLWNKCQALDSRHLAGYLYTPQVINFIKKSLNAKFKSKFSDDNIINGLNNLVTQQIPLESIKKSKPTKPKKEKSIIEKPVTTSMKLEDSASNALFDPILPN